MTGRQACVEADLGALRRNLRRLRAAVGDVAVLAVVKADAYGHGAVPVARTLAEESVDWLGVALVEEAAQLREAGVQTRILLLGQVHAGQLDEVRALDLVPTVSSLEQLRMWSRSAGCGERGLHLKLDTGMHRLGVARADWEAAAEILTASPQLRLTGLLSHLAETTDPTSERNGEQDRSFAEGRAMFSELGGGSELLIHLCSSAGALHRPAGRHGLVRCGLALYGIDPSGDDGCGLEPVMAVRGPVVHVVQVAVGEAVGYGSTWRAQRPSRIGVVAIGYGDGYPWRLGGRGRVQIGGDDVPLVGQVNMDMIQVDLTDTRAGVGDVATLLARESGQGPTARELAELAGTSTYEILCRFGVRLPKRYVDGNGG